MLKRAGSDFRSKVSGRMMFIYAVVLIAFFGISSTAGAMKIYVFITRTEETIELEVNLRTTVFEVKYLIKDMKGLKPDRQHLFYIGYELSDKKKLMDYHIYEGATLVLRTDAESYPFESESYPFELEPVFYALPEDEIGAYAIRDDGTKEYLLFHTYDICMDWLASDELCAGFERCFHKDGK